MKFFQKRSVAVVLTLLIILASIGLGQVRRPVQSSPAPEPADPSALDTSLNTSGYTDWLWDEAGVLSDATEETLCLYNANWDARYGMIMAVAAVSDTDGMAIDRDGNLILSCPNFADLSMPSCVLKIDKDRNIKKWFDVPRNEYTGEARAMGIEFGPDGDLYLVDNAGWTGEPHMVFTGRILRLRLNDAGVVKCTVVADNMEHPNGIRIWGDYMYVTQSCMTRQKTDSGKLMSCVYRFPLDAEGIHCTNTLADPHIFLTFITENPKCQYGVDGIVFDHDGNLYVGNFGDGVVHKITFNPDGSVKENRKWACDPANLKSTDGMTIDPYGNIYVADFSANAIARITPDGRVTRMACSPDTDGFHGELDEPGEPCVWGDKIIVSCFDLVTDEEKVNTAHEMPATMAMLDVEP